MNLLTFPVPIQHRHSDYLIKLVHHKLEIDSDLEMTATILLEFWTKDEQGGFDTPVLNVIRQNESLTDKQKANDIRVFNTLKWSSSTKGSRVAPATGAFVYPDEQGNYPEGSITQLEYWQAAPSSAFLGKTLAEKVYAAILSNMEQVYALGNI